MMYNAPKSHKWHMRAVKLHLNIWKLTTGSIPTGTADSLKMELDIWYLSWWETRVICNSSFMQLISLWFTVQFSSFRVKCPERSGIHFFLFWSLLKICVQCIRLIAVCKNNYVFDWVRICPRFCESNNFIVDYDITLH